MSKVSAGLLLYRVRDERLEVLLVHPGGPFWAKKDLGSWTIPKGEIVPGEDPLAAAIREFEEELGFAPQGKSLKILSPRRTKCASLREGLITSTKLREIAPAWQHGYFQLRHWRSSALLKTYNCTHPWQ